MIFKARIHLFAFIFVKNSSKEFNECVEEQGVENNVSAACTGNFFHFTEHSVNIAKRYLISELSVPAYVTCISFFVISIIVVYKATRIYPMPWFTFQKGKK